MTSQGGPYVGNPGDPEFINFALGQPSPRLLPLELLAHGASELASADRLVLQYGATQGFAPFREALSAFLSAQHGCAIAAGELALTGAVSLSLSLIADQLGRRRGRVLCEDPTYFLARGIFDSAGLESGGVPVDEQGIRVDLLAQRIEGGDLPDFVYVIPNFQNPTGSSMSAQRRDALFELAHAHDFFIVSDEPYNLLHFEEGSVAPRPLASYAEAGDRVVSVSSFTKILAPGLRTGWWQASPDMMQRLQAHGSLRSGGNLNPVMGQILLPIIAGGGLTRQLGHLRDTLGQRRDTMAAAIRQHLPAARFTNPGGGYFMWVDMGPGVDTRTLRREAKRHQVGFCPGYRCAVEADLSQFARLSFAFYEPAEIEQGVQRLAQALQSTKG